jgi:hypothetical protein
VFLEATQVAILAERIGGVLKDIEETLAMELTGLPPAQYAAVAKAKVVATAQRGPLRELLGLDDDG